MWWQKIYILHNCFGSVMYKFVHSLVENGFEVILLLPFRDPSCEHQSWGFQSGWAEMSSFSWPPPRCSPPRRWWTRQEMVGKYFIVCFNKIEHFITGAACNYVRNAARRGAWLVPPPHTCPRINMSGSYRPPAPAANIGGSPGEINIHQEVVAPVLAENRFLA